MATRVEHADSEEAAYRAIFEASSDGLVINDAETGVVLEANPAFCRMHGYEHMAGLHPSAFIHPSSHPLFEAYVRAIRGGQEFRARAQDMRRDGSLFDVEVLGRGFIYQGRLAMLGVVRDVTETVRAYQNLEELVGVRTGEIERRRQVAEALSELLTVVNSRRTLDEMLDAIVAQAARLLGSNAEALYLRDARDPNLLRLQASRNIPPDGESPCLVVGTPVVGLAAQRLKPVLAADLPKLVSRPLVATVDEQIKDRGAYLEVVSRGPSAAEHPRFEHSNRIMAQQFRSLLAVPLVARGDCHGSLLLAYREWHVPSEEELELVGAFASQAGLAIENARLQEQAEQRRREADRRRQIAEALRGLLATVNSTRTLDEVLEEVASQARRLLGSDASAIYLPDRGGQEVALRAYASSGLDATYASFSIPTGISATGLAFDRRRSIAIYDVPATLPDDPDADFEPVLEERGSHLRAVYLPTTRGPSGPGSEQARRLGAYAAGYRALLSVPLAVKTEAYGALTLYFRESREFANDHVELTAAFADQAALAIQNARLHEQAESQRHELEALYEADEALHQSLRLQDVLDALLEAATGLLGGDAVGLWGPDPHDGSIVPLAARGLSDHYLQQTIALNDEPEILRYWWAQAPFSVDDVSSDPRIPQPQRDILLSEGMRSLLTTHVRVGGALFGSFTVARRTPHHFTEQEQRLLSAIAQRAGVAIQNARLYEQAQQAATLEERQRLARELHDAVTQTLFSTALIAEVLPDLWDLDPREGRERLAELRRLTRGALAEMRTLLVELRPGALKELALGELLRQLAEATAGRTRLEVSSQVHGQPRPLPADVHVALYRLAQEALNNVVKHAHARNVTVELFYVADGVRLRLIDDGCGFDPDEALVRAGHFGLGIMRERAESIGAKFQLMSQPGTGTVVDVTWPETEDRQH